MSHYIRTIHTDFTSRTAPAYAGSSAAAHAGILLNLGGLMNSNPAKYPPGLGHSDWRTGAQTRRTRRAGPAVSCRSPHSPPARRATPPPPPRTSYMKFDPFSDDLDIYTSPSPITVSDPVLYRTPRSTPASISAPRSQSAPTFTLRIPSQPPKRQQQQPGFDPNARSRLVAGILLNRVHAVGRPMRRRSFDDGPREYVKSGLSSVVSVEA
ncbi:hypothetical protein C0991_002795 [Blastosporella zonata]|nr:hypothetical protein C0991_002795 [Blastosporella zonata]